MSEKRKKTHAILLRAGGKVVASLSLYPAEQWVEGAEQSGLFRVRIERPVSSAGPREEWHSPYGPYSFLSFAAAFELGATLLGETTPAAPELLPEIPVGTPVSVPNGRVVGGEAMRDVTRTATPPIREHTGRVMVGCYLYNRGMVFVPVDDLVFKGR